MKPIAIINGTLQGLNDQYIAVAIGYNKWQIWYYSIYEEMIKRKEEAELKLP